MSKPKLVIFDMDGLMLDTETIAIQGWKEAASKLNITIPDDIYPHLIGINRDLCKITMEKWLGPDFDFDTAHAALHQSMDAQIKAHGIPLKPGLLHLLGKLEENGIKKSVATGTGIKRAIDKLTIVDIVHRFSTIVGGDQILHSKPAPDIFLKAAEICNVSPSDCIVLEDSNPGAEGAYRAGMKVIVVPDLVPPTEATSNRALAICKDLYQAWELINTL